MTRIGLVLGAGGHVGSAFHYGVLSALHDVTGWDPRDADVIVGTSAGSITGAWLRAGISAGDLAATMLGSPRSPEGQAVYDEIGAAEPLGRGTRSGAVPASPRLLRRAHRLRPGVVGSGLLPAGGTSGEPIVSGLRRLTGDRWPDRDFRACAVDLDSGELVDFGGPGRPRPALADAVMASCAIPAYFSPVVIDGRRYVDGGAHSHSNADVLRGADLDLLIVSSPITYQKGAMRPRIDSPIRAVQRRYLSRELRSLSSSDARDRIVLEPGARELALMSANTMDQRHTRRLLQSTYDSTAALLARMPMTLGALKSA